MNDAMNDQSRPEQPEDGQGTGDGATRAADSRDTAAKKTATKQDVHAPELHGKRREAYLDPSGSEATREMRDTARRRRDAEEKLQQHLIEAKDHIPNEHHPGHH